MGFIADLALTFIFVLLVMYFLGIGGGDNGASV